jgi:hypothetical protein
VQSAVKELKFKVAVEELEDGSDGKLKARKHM